MPGGVSSMAGRQFSQSLKQGSVSPSPTGFVCLRRRGSIMSPQSGNSRLRPGYQFCAGAIAGLFAETVMHPLDTLNTRLKLQSTQANRSLLVVARSVFQYEGLRGFFGGVTATLLCALPSTGLYFGVYELVKENGCHRVDKDMEPAVHLLAGGLSELAASFIVVPFEVVKSRLQLGTNPALFTGGAVTKATNYNSALGGLYTIGKTEGLKGVYAGYKPSVTSDCLYSAIQFALYEQIQKVIRGKRLEARARPDSYIHNETVCDLAAGALSGGSAAFLTNPIDLATNRLMVQAYAPSAIPYEGMVQCIKQVYATEGCLALWKGSSARVLSIMPISALTFCVYERMKVAFLFAQELSGNG